MTQKIVHIYYKKKYLKRDFVLVLFSLLIWLAIYFVTVFPLILNRHPNVSESVHIISTGILTFIFFVWALKLIHILYGCFSAYKIAPSIAYSLSNEGITSAKNKWFEPWSEIIDATTMVKNQGFYFRKSKTKGFLIPSWGIDPEDMKLAKKFTLQRLAETKTKRLR